MNSVEFWKIIRYSTFVRHKAYHFSSKKMYNMTPLHVFLILSTTLIYNNINYIYMPRSHLKYLNSDLKICQNGVFTGVKREGGKVWRGKGEVALKCTLHLLSRSLGSHPHAPSRLDYLLLKTTGPQTRHGRYNSSSVYWIISPAYIIYLYQLPVFNSRCPLKKVTSWPHDN